MTSPRDRQSTLGALACTLNFHRMTKDPIAVGGPELRPVLALSCTRCGFIEFLNEKDLVP